MERIQFIEPIRCTDCRAAFLKLSRNGKAREMLIAERMRRAPCRNCASLSVYKKGGI